MPSWRLNWRFRNLRVKNLRHNASAHLTSSGLGRRAARSTIGFFLVLIVSQDSVERPQYLYHWLQRFDLTGKPVGKPLDLAQFLPEDLSHANWEGLSWFEPGKRLVLVHEGNRRQSCHAFILNLPEDWQFVAETR